MPSWESFIAYGTTVNAEIEALAALAPTSLRVNDKEVWGEAKLTHLMALSSTDDVNHAYVVPPGYHDSSGIEVPLITRYGATASFDISKAKLPRPVPLTPNETLAVYAQSETAANTVCFVWGRIEYSGKGSYAAQGGAGLTQRDLDAGGALTSIVEAAGTAISGLQASRKYQIAGIMGVGVDGQTAGIVGPAFVRFDGGNHDGCKAFIPLPNSANYVAAGGGAWMDLAAAGISMPVFGGANTITPYFIGYTAERPQGRLILSVDKTY